MKAKIDRLAELNKKKQKIYGNVDACQKNQPSLIAKKEKLKKFIHPKWNSTELVPKGQKEINKALETGSGNHKQEAMFIKELQFLKESMPYIKEKEEIQAQLDEM